MRQACAECAERGELMEAVRRRREAQAGLMRRQVRPQRSETRCGCRSVHTTHHHSLPTPRPALPAPHRAPRARQVAAQRQEIMQLRRDVEMLDMVGAALRAQGAEALSREQRRVRLLSEVRAAPPAHAPRLHEPPPSSAGEWATPAHLHPHLHAHLHPDLHRAGRLRPLHCGQAERRAGAPYWQRAAY